MNDNNRNTRSASKIHLNSFDDLFGMEESNPENHPENNIGYIPIQDLHPFQDHPFRVLDDEKMEETVASIREYGVLTPGIARPRKEGGYELISGHCRRRACELVGLQEMPVLIREYSDDEATVIMVDSNIRREDILPSEKAFSYKMKYEALKHQGSKSDRYTYDAVGSAAGDTGKTVQRYLRLTELIPGLLQKEKALVGAVEHIKEAIVGKNPFQIEKIWHDTYRDAYWRGGAVLMSALSDPVLFPVSYPILIRSKQQVFRNEPVSEENRYPHIPFQSGVPAGSCSILSRNKRQAGWYSLKPFRCCNARFTVGIDMPDGTDKFLPYFFVRNKDTIGFLIVG